MDFISIKKIGKTPKLSNPILIEGLPGIGNVGKLAVEHLIDTINAKKFAEIYSKDFPPQVFINPDGTVELVKNEFYYWKAKKQKQRDLILLTGDYQGLSSRGQYELVDCILDTCEELGANELFTLGGYGLGHDISKPKVLCATTHKELVKEMKKHGAVFKKNEPGGGIVGASGLLLGLGKLRDFKGACFMGETPGYLVDPKSAKEVLKILMSITQIEIDLSALENKAKEIELIAQQLKEMEGPVSEKTEDLKYIG
ncbi:MAG: proteasome assembly chaperone family protein [Candidatus Thermoplasmatota archaeon]|nr:proteasome assembly chaperone family protein [Candidatus Thermoplasmatota archaeon]